MNVNDITQLIGTLGFPIVCCIALFWQNNKWEERHEKETSAFATAINNNTMAIEKLTAMLQERSN